LLFPPGLWWTLTLGTLFYPMFLWFIGGNYKNIIITQIFKFFWHYFLGNSKQLKFTCSIKIPMLLPLKSSKINKIKCVISENELLFKGSP
jgi:hypothetical protein